jgi:hypothetical protein
MSIENKGGIMSTGGTPDSYDRELWAKEMMEFA